MNPNTANIPDSPEGAVNTSSPAQDSGLHTRFYNSFVSQKYAENGVDFVNKISAMDELDSETKDEIQKFIDQNHEFDALGNNFLQEVSLSKIKNRAGEHIVKYRHARENFANAFLERYDVNESEYNTKISQIAETLEYEQLRDLHKNPHKIDTFLEENNLASYQRRDVKSILDDLNIAAVVDAITPKEQKEQFIERLAVMQSSLDTNSPNFAHNFASILQELFDAGLISGKHKAEIIHQAIPYISLHDATRIGLLDETKQKKYIYDVVLDGVENKDEIYWYIKRDISGIQVKTSDFTSQKDIDTLVEKYGFYDFGKRVQSMIEQEQNKDAPKNLAGLQARMAEDYGEKVTHPELLDRGSIMTIEIKQDDGSTQTQYHQISLDSVGEDHRSISFSNKGGDGQYYPKQYDEVKHTSYADFLSLLDAENTLGVTFETQDMFDEHIKNGSIIRDDGQYSYRNSIDREALENKLDQDGATAAERAEALWNTNAQELKTQLDAIDADGKKYGFDTGTTFRNRKGDIYTIESIEDDGIQGAISLQMIGGEVQQGISFEVFHKEFRSQGCTRTSNVTDPVGLIDDINIDDSLWSGVEYKKGGLYKKGEKDKSYECKHIVSPNGERFFGDYDVVEIKKFHGDSVEITAGKTGQTEKKDPQDGEKTKVNTYEMQKGSVTVSLGTLSTWIKHNKMQAKSIDQENIVDWTDDKEGPEEIRRNFWANYVNNFYSIFTTISVGKKYLEFWENYLNEGRDEQTNRILAKIPVFTNEQKSAQITNVENAEKKRMDEFIEALKIRESAESTQMVLDWLLNGDSLQAQREAALMYMAEKYGVLYEKKPLMPYKGTWLWYKALGGQVNDKFFREKKAKAESEGVQFTEELLVWELIAKQCKGYAKPKRRGKMYKELEALLGKGREDEIEKGKGDTAKKNTYAAKTHFAIDEMANGGWPNTVGAFEEILGKGDGGSIVSLNAVPFVMMTSGVAHSLDPGQANKFKNGMVPTQFFLGLSSRTDIHNKTVVKLAQAASERLGGKYAGMGETFRKLIEEGRNSSGKKLNETERVWESFRLYKEAAGGAWGDLLGRSLMMLNTRKEDPESEFETWIFDHKDEDDTFRDYYAAFMGGLNSTESARFENKGLLEDGFESNYHEPGTGGLTAWNTYEFVKKFLEPASSGVGFREKKLGTMYWKEIIGQIDAIAGNQSLNEQYKRKRLFHILAPLMDALSESYGQNNDYLGKILENKANLFNARFTQWGVELSDWNRGDGAFREGYGKGIIDRYINNILSSSVSGNGGSIQGNVYSLDAVRAAKKGVNTTIDNPSAAIQNKARQDIGIDDIIGHQDDTGDADAA